MFAAPPVGQLVQTHVLVACGWFVLIVKPVPPLAHVAEPSVQTTPADSVKPGSEVQAPVVR